MYCRTDTDRGRSRTLAICLLAIAAWLGGQGPQASAGAGEGGVTCASHGRVMDVRIFPGHNTATIRRDGQSIDVNGSACATVEKTVLVDVTGSRGKDVLRIQLAGGQFVQRAGTRIRFNVDLKEGWDRLGVVGTSKRDLIVLGLNGINLAAQVPRPVDVKFANLERVIVNSRGGNDVVSANGGKGTGATSHLRGRTTVFAGRGRDLVIGSNPSHPRIGHAAGKDCTSTTCKGTGGVDDLHGGPDPDTIKALEGGDCLHGDAGLDYLYGGLPGPGGTGHDTCHPGPGPAGQPNHDTCWRGLGGAKTFSCEVIKNF